MWSKIKMLDSKWKPWIVVILIIVIWVVASMVIERIDCAITAKKADTAYANGNFVDAELYFDSLLYNETDSENSVSYRYCPNRTRDIDEERNNEIDTFNSAVQSQEQKDYQSAVERYKIYLNYYPQGRLRDDAEKRLSEIYQLWSQDTGKAGKDLMLEMYKTGCSGGEWISNIPSLDTIINDDLESKYWYPEAGISDSKYIAKLPAEFRIAICYEYIQTTDTVETCLYTNSLGANVDSIVRRNAIYEIELLDLLTHKTIAKYQPMYSLPPEACPQTITSGVSLFDYDEIVGEPDFTTVTSWIDEQIQSLK